ncbi:hypothetical protein SAMN05216255_2014 [Pseudomonas segetis]|uniref:Transposase n=1 Tax=Pseudomonas segetis TaxID=298908 RepID=A0A239D141_9PSED|nr:hypothetical protein SAMN05216255_2014 [Pseudomonas segetis]
MQTLYWVMLRTRYNNIARPRSQVNRKLLEC